MENEEESISDDQSDGDESDHSADDIIIHKHRADSTTSSPVTIVDPSSEGAVGSALDNTEEDESCCNLQDLSIDDLSAIKITSTAKQFSVACINVYTNTPVLYSLYRNDYFETSTDLCEDRLQTMGTTDSDEE